MPLLGFCTNVYPSHTLDDLRGIVIPGAGEVRRLCGSPRLPVGLHLPRAVLRELVDDSDACREQHDALQAQLTEQSLRVYTLNAFPYGDFQAERVKEQVYEPDWQSAERRQYTLEAATFLANQMGEGDYGSISTLAGGFRDATDSDESRKLMAKQLVEVAAGLWRFMQEHKRHIMLCLEPEPFTTIENARELIAFFENFVLPEARLRMPYLSGGTPSDGEARVRQVLGVCFDVCHHAVMFEDPIAELQALADAGIRVGKLQVSNALQVSASNADERDAVISALRSYVEPRFLHQTMVRSDDGSIQRFLDLDAALAWMAGPAALESGWLARVHYHVPLFFESGQGVLGSTSASLRELLRSDLAQRIPHWEVETYTWNVLPEATRAASLNHGIANEIAWVLRNAQPDAPTAPSPLSTDFHPA